MIKADSVFTGATVDAGYHDSEDPMNKHNCYVEALPRILTSGRATSLMRRQPAYHKAERLLPPEMRLHGVQRIANYIDPTCVLLDIEQRFSRLIRNGYVSRNPLSAEWRSQMLAGFPTIDEGKDIPGYRPIIRSTASGFFAIGISGVGKSTAIESVLSLYPQVIVHTEYNGRPFDQRQLVWLKLDCPHDGSVKGLCISFFHALDSLLGTSFHNKYCSKKNVTAHELLPVIARLSAQLGLGVLVIDEIQRLSLAKSGGSEEMLEFFVLLVNTIGVPVVLVGTFKAFPILTGAFAMARRGEGQGDLIWPTLKEKEADWGFFLNELWKYQWTSVHTELTEEIKKVIYEESQGITDIVIKLYMLAQWSVIGGDDEILTPEIFRAVARDSLQLAQPILAALRTGNTEILCKIPDIQSPLSNIESYFDAAAKRVAAETLAREKQKSLPSDIFSQVLTQLVIGGLDEKEAKYCADLAIARCGKGAGLREILASAFQLSIAKPKGAATKAPPPTLKEKITKVPPSESDLRSVVKKGKEEGISSHDALEKAGVTKSSSEFLD